jgi:hypothetical protein
MQLGPRQRIYLLVLLLASTEVHAEDRAHFFSTHCVDCHGPDVKKGNFRVDELPQSLTELETFARWVRVFDKVAKGEMPPKKSDPPTAEERKDFVAALRKDLVEAEQKQMAAGLHTSVRRLNRVEYENTLRDLLALPNLRVKESLPEDGQQHGFDKVAGALDISPIHSLRCAADRVNCTISTALERHCRRRQWTGLHYWRRGQRHNPWR